MTDKELIQGMIKGNETAARFLVDEYQVMVYNTCYSFLRNLHNAEDVTQEVFIEAIRHASRFRSEAKVGTWLYRIAINRSLNYIRNNRKRQFWQEIDDYLQWDKTGAETNTDLLEREEQKTMLSRAIDALPKNQRIAFTLNKMEELPYAAVAEIMELKLPAVESLLHRAKMNLQKKLKAYYKI